MPQYQIAIPPLIDQAVDSIHPSEAIHLPHAWRNIKKLIKDAEKRMENAVSDSSRARAIREAGFVGESVILPVYALLEEDGDGFSLEVAKAISEFCLNLQQFRTMGHRIVPPGRS